MPTTRDTIVAVSSPPGRSARGLVRLTGPGVRDVLGQLLLEPTDPPLRQLFRCVIDLPPQLPALGAFFAGPASYTGQDLAELQCAGNPALLERLLKRIIAAGARLAEPGEFTFRAFTAGKIDLTQAEGIAATIAAETDAQLRAAAALRSGQLGRQSQTLVDQLAGALALVEAGIDFTDQEDVVAISPADLDARLAAIEEAIDAVLRFSRSWGELTGLPRVVLVGAPSTGKSTLFNALLGRDRAVVSAAPGTTRDVLEEPIDLPENSEAMLVDLAGLEDPRTALDRDVQAAARRALESAELVLQIDDEQQEEADTFFPPHLGGADRLRVRSKADLPARAPADPPFDLSVSVADGASLDALRRAIAERLGRREQSAGAQAMALQPRHENALRAALSQARAARELLAHQKDQRALDDPELVAAAMRAALDELAGLGGRMSPDDILGRVFATFCIGK